MRKHLRLVIGLVLATVIGLTATALEVAPSQASSPCDLAAGWGRAENDKLPGRPADPFTPRPASQALAIFAETPVTTCDGPVVLRIGATTQMWHVVIYRVGWYGGKLARRVFQTKTQEPTGSAIRAIQSGRPITKQSYGFVGSAGGRSLKLKSLFLKPGLYFARLMGALGNHADAPFIVNSAKKTSATVFVPSFMTASEYNQWGGGSAYVINYRSPQKNPNGEIQQWARYVSYKKPWDRFMSIGATGDSSMVSWIEKSADATDYVADMSLGTTVNLSQYKLVLLGSHAEYQTDTGHLALTRAVAQGVNLASFGANEVYWRATLRNSASFSGFLSVNRAENIDQFSNLGRPSEPITGASTSCVGASRVLLHVSEPANALLSGIDPELLATDLPGLFAQETNNTENSIATSIHILASGNGGICERPGEGRSWQAQMSETLMPSGSRIFNAGGLGFACSLLMRCPAEFGTTSVSATFTRKLLENLLAQYTQR